MSASSFEALGILISLAISPKGFSSIKLDFTAQSQQAEIWVNIRLQEFGVLLATNQSRIATALSRVLKGRWVLMQFRTL